MDLISVAIEPRGPIITGEEGRWLSAQRWINMHNVLLAADCVGPDRDMLIPPAPVEAVLLLRDGSIVPFSGYEPHESDVVASSGEGYQVWAPLPPAAERSTGDPVVASPLRWDVVLGAQPIRITLHTGVQLEASHDGCAVLTGDPASVNLYPLFEDGVLAGEANQVTIFHKGNLLLVCSELWAYACNIGPMAPTVSAGAVITPSVESPVGNDLWAALASAASIRLASMVVTADAVQVSGQLITSDLVFSDDVDDDGEAGGDEGTDELSGQSLRGTLLELLALDSSIDILKQQLAHALAALNTARDELTAKSEELVSLQLAISALQSSHESLNQRLLLLEQAPQCCCRCCGQEACSCGCGGGGSTGDTGSPGDFQIPEVGTGEGVQAPDPVVLPPEDESFIDRTVPPEVLEGIDVDLGRPQPAPPEFVDSIIVPDPDAIGVMEKVAVIVQLPWVNMFTRKIEREVAGRLEYGGEVTMGNYTYGLSNHNSVFLYNEVSGQRSFHKQTEFCWPDIIENFGICIPFSTADIAWAAQEFGVTPSALLRKLQEYTPRADVATWWAAFWTGVAQFDSQPPDVYWGLDAATTNTEIRHLQMVMLKSLYDNFSNEFMCPTDLRQHPYSTRLGLVISAFILTFAKGLLEQETDALLVHAEATLAAEGDVSAMYEFYPRNRLLIELGLMDHYDQLTESRVPPAFDWVLNAVSAEANSLLMVSPSSEAVYCTDVLGPILRDLPPPSETGEPSTLVPQQPRKPPRLPSNGTNMVILVIGGGSGSYYNKQPVEIWPVIGAYWNNAHGSPNRITSPYLQT